MAVPFIYICVQTLFKTTQVDNDIDFVTVNHSVKYNAYYGAMACILPYSFSLSHPSGFCIGIQ